MANRTGDDEEEDEEDASGQDGVVVRPRSLWEKFRRGDKYYMLSGAGVFIGAGLASGFVSGWRRVAYNATTSGQRHLFWIGGAAVLFTLFYQPGKFKSWRYPLGAVWMEWWTDYAFLAAAALIACAVLYPVGRWS